MISTYIQDPNALLDYKFDWAASTNNHGATNWLSTGETITAASLTATGLTLSTSSITDTNTSVTFWLSGGTAGSSYNVVCHILTSASRKDDRTIRIKVEDR